MDSNLQALLDELLAGISHIDYVRSANIPNINLYMDQVTTFMEDELQGTKRYPEDKILTKTMINNYAKNHLLPSPEKKKYTKEHVLLLTFIYYFKQILSIKDIETMLAPITERYFDTFGAIDIQGIYDEILSLQKTRIKELQQNVASSFNQAASCFDDNEGLSDEELEYLKKFTFICNLSFDVYVKKHLIETMIDDLTNNKPVKDKKNKK